MKGRRKKTKYSMVFATMVAMLSVCTAGVSTFAWFQASSEVRVSAASSSTTITVADPGETAYTGLYIFQDNYTESGSGSEGSKKAIVGKFPTERSSLASSIAFDGEGAQTNFKRLVARDISTTTPSYYTRASSFLPGQRISFAILVDGDAEKSRTLSVSSFATSGGTGARYLHNGSQATSTPITMAAAINVYATYVSGNYSDGTFTSATGTTGDIISKFLKGNTDSAGTALDDQFTYAPGDSTSTSYPLTRSASSNDTLFLYTIEFGDTDTEHYRQVTSANTPTPVYVSPDFSRTTYWQQYDDGSSEVFQNLSFNISSLLILAN